jgi:hypothetical protein
MANSYSDFEIIRVTPTIIAGTTHAEDVMFNATEIPNAVIGNGGCSKLLGITITDQDKEDHNMDIVFMSVQTNLGTAGAAADIAANDMLAADITSSLKIDWGTASSSFSNFSMYTSSAHAVDDDNTQLPILLQANAGSTSVYFTAIAKEEMAFAATDDLEFIFHIQKR